MSNIANCKQCGKTFEQKRSDHLFCSAKCVAAHYRDIPNPDMIHAAKEHRNIHYCEECGMPFWTNDYAERGGKRAPKYDSPKCKQKAYRARGKEAQPQAERRYTTEGKNRAEYDHERRDREQAERDQRSEYDRFQREQAEFQECMRRHQEQRERYEQRNQQNRQNSQSHSTLNNHEKACQILGVTEPLNASKIKKAYYKAMKLVHPDIYKGKDATQKAQAVNWAYEYLKSN